MTKPLLIALMLLGSVSAFARDRDDDYASWQRFREDVYRNSDVGRNQAWRERQNRAAEENNDAIRHDEVMKELRKIRRKLDE